jgi:hypothetical protein
VVGSFVNVFADNSVTFDPNAYFDGVVKAVIIGFTPALIYIIRAVRNALNEVKSPNGLRTGQLVHDSLNEMQIDIKSLLQSQAALQQLHLQHLSDEHGIEIRQSGEMITIIKTLQPLQSGQSTVQVVNQPGHQTPDLPSDPAQGSHSH